MPFFNPFSLFVTRPQAFFMCEVRGTPVYITSDVKGRLILEIV